jgi:hypothetical protein
MRMKAFGANVAVVMRNAATNVQEVIIPNAGHWLMEEAPASTIAAVLHASHSGLLEPRGTSTVRKAPGVRDSTTWSVNP